MISTSFSKLVQIGGHYFKRRTGSTDLTAPEHSGHQVQHWFIALVLAAKKHPSCVYIAVSYAYSVNVQNMREATSRHLSFSERGAVHLEL